MAKFITRILLLKGEAKDYETLHREIAKDPAVLKKKKLSVKADKSKKGEFNYWGNITLKDVADAVVRAVRKTGRDYSFTIMKDRDNLKPVRV